jgi:hypothetical protein
MDRGDAGNEVLVMVATMCGFFGRLIKRYWLHLLVLIGACSYFLWMTAPDITWVNTDCDGTIYLNSANHAILSFAQGSPVYNMLNWMIVRIPIGTEFWRLSAVSSLAAGITALLLFIIARRYTPSKVKALVAPLIFCASGVVVSQATILDSYSLTTMLSVLAFYLHLKDKIKSKYFVLALGLGVHHLILFPLAYIWLADVVKRHKTKQKMFRPAMFIPALGLLFFVWVFLINRPPYNLISGESLRDYATYFFGQGSLIGGLAVSSLNDVVRRAQDATLILSLGFGLSTLMIFPMVWKCFKTKGVEALDNKILALLYISPIIYYVTDKDPQTYVYTIMAFAFGSLLAVQGIEWLTHREKEKPLLDQLMDVVPTVLASGIIMSVAKQFGLVKPLSKWGQWKYKTKSNIRMAFTRFFARLRRNYKLQYAISIAIGVVSIGLMIFNTQVYDIGKNLDPTLTAAQYQTTVSEVPDGDYIYTNICSITAQSFWIYNQEGGDVNVIPMGYRRPSNESVEVAQRAYDEGKLWVVDKVFAPSGRVLPAQHKVTAETYVSDFKNISATSNQTQPFDSSAIETGWVNPVDLITGKLIYTRWSTVASSNLTAGYLVMWAFAGLYSLDFTNVIWGRKVKNKTKLKLLNIITVAVLVGFLVLICVVSGMKMIWMR